MSQLLCTYASKNSRPEKIRQFIEYLHDRCTPDLDPTQREVVEQLIDRATGWLAPQTGSHVSAR